MKQLIVMGFAVFLCARCACTKPISEVLPVPLDAQQTDSWCWAAGGEMTMEFIGGGSVEQCDEANKQFGQKDCCKTPLSVLCNRGGLPEYAKFNFSYTASWALSWDQLVEQIHCKRKPFGLSWRWPEGGGHFMVARGYIDDAGFHFVLMNDPWPPPTVFSPGGDFVWMTYDEYVQRPGHHLHMIDYSDITKN